MLYYRYNYTNGVRTIVGKASNSSVGGLTQASEKGLFSDFLSRRKHVSNSFLARFLWIAVVLVEDILALPSQPDCHHVILELLAHFNDLFDAFGVDEVFFRKGLFISAQKVLMQNINFGKVVAVLDFVSLEDFKQVLSLWHVKQILH